MPPLLRTALACLLVFAGPAWAGVETFQLDPVHTRVAFRIDHAGFSKAIGTFSGAAGTLAFDPGDWSTATLDVSIPLATLDIGDPAWRDKVLDRTFLDAGQQPAARFVSTRVEPGEPGQARVFGQLSLRGVSREVVLDVRLNALRRHPLTQRRTAGFSATGTLRRSDFGMDAWRRVVGDEVELLIEVEATRTRKPTPSPRTEPDDADQEPR
ncbi:MAG TPA: YceI family protein [Arenimonas sp.]|nr:YceI family protein [Arenimonas sp.]